jgi:hypothetical protein
LADAVYSSRAWLNASAEKATRALVPEGIVTTAVAENVDARGDDTFSLFQAFNN